jgi:hypothetical protein
MGVHLHHALMRTDRRNASRQWKPCGGEVLGEAVADGPGAFALGECTAAPLSPKALEIAESASSEASAPALSSASAKAQAGGCSDPAYKAQNAGEYGTNGCPVSDPGDNYCQGVVVDDDTPDCARPKDVMESGLCAP